jgi:hypothetical protein
MSWCNLFYSLYLDAKLNVVAIGTFNQSPATLAYCLRSTTIEVCPRLVMRQPLDLDRALNHEKQ